MSNRYRVTWWPTSGSPGWCDVRRTGAMLIAAVLLGAVAGRAVGQVGDVTRVHDPAIAESDAGGYVIFSTGTGIAVRTSDDLYHWTSAPPVMTARTIPGWTQDVAKTDYFWAPDVSFFNGRWHLYYSISSFGSQRSAIGLLTSTAIDPADPKYKWTDRGMVLQTHTGDDWNAIDPNIVTDATGRVWLSAGSFWTGIKLVRIDPKTGLPLKGAKLLPIAGRPGEGDAIEAPFIFRHERSYFLLVSFDRCCRGSASTYNLRVGRAKRVDGPYVDADGKPMRKGGATALLSGQGDVRGPGHGAVIHTRGRDYVIHHYYDAAHAGIPTLQIRPLTWDKAGWPVAGDPIDGPVDPTTRPATDDATHDPTEDTADKTVIKINAAAHDACGAGYPPVFAGKAAPG